ncbi:MAG TPA: RNA-binding S4 domain-containing protein [Acidimicrobiales bacterium]|nr:RNA-binding S4 domain-containing protein [Acidimicrobiales bacterium]
MEVTRVDKWLWAVRVAPTRSAASELCRAGHVKVNGANAKPSTAVRRGDEVIARAGERTRVLEVLEVIDKRVGAALAASCMLDRSPPPPSREDRAGVGLRDPAAGRPTKRDRRQIDRLRGR